MGFSKIHLYKKSPFFSKRLFLVLLGFSAPLLLWAQAPPPPIPINGALLKRKVVLEQFTGIHCNTCPVGHRIADSLKAAKPAGSVFIVTIPAGNVASPLGIDPDFRTGDGNSIAGQSGLNLSSYPAATINRQRFANTSGMALSPSQWGKYIDTVQARDASHNIALYGYIDVATRNLKVFVDVFAHEFAEPVPNRNLTVMLLEDSVSGPQDGAYQYSSQLSNVDGSYNHNYLLRKIISPPFIPTTTGAIAYPANPAGVPISVVSSIHNYTIPAQYVNNPAILGNLRVIAFLSYAEKDIITAATGPLLVTGFTFSKDAELMPDVRIEKEVCNATLKPFVRIYNNSRNLITSVTLQSSLNGGAFLPAGGFAGTLAPASSRLVAVPPIVFAPNDTNDVRFKIVNVNGSPDPNPANDTLSVNQILRTRRTSAGVHQVMRFRQDRYGSQTTWKIVEEATGTVKLAGGPYPDLPYNGTIMHADSFVAIGETCYEIIVNDAAANGINNGAGVGGYEVTSNGAVVFTSAGTFGARERSTFKTVEKLENSPVAGLLETRSFEETVTLIPNPTAGESNLVFTLEKGSAVSVQVLDMTGRMVAQIGSQNLSAGTHRLPIVTGNLPGGVYNIRLAAAGGAVMRRLVVLK